MSSVYELRRLTSVLKALRLAILKTGAIVRSETVYLHSCNKEGGIMSKQQKAAGAPSTARESMEDEIRSLAYQLYCEGGYQDGRDLEYWLKAEQQAMVRRKAHLRRVV
jgi:hypothetical protein